MSLCFKVALLLAVLASLVALVLYGGIFRVLLLAISPIILGLVIEMVGDIFNEARSMLIKYRQPSQIILEDRSRVAEEITS